MRDRPMSNAYCLLNASVCSTDPNPMPNFKLRPLSDV